MTKLWFRSEDVLKLIDNALTPQEQAIRLRGPQHRKLRELMRSMRRLKSPWCGLIRADEILIACGLHIMLIEGPVYIGLYGQDKEIYNEGI